MRLDLRGKSFAGRPVLGALALEVAAGERVALSARPASARPR